MSEEDRALLAQISQLAGQINRHRNQQAGIPVTTHPPHRTFARPAKTADSDQFEEASSTGRGFYRGHGRASYAPRGSYRVAKPAPHRHRTLVLNGASGASKSDVDSGAASDASSSSWVTKSDRHLQLINTAVYEKESQARVKAIEQSRLQKQQQKDDRERSKLFNHFSRMANGAAVATSTNPSAAANHEVTIDGIRLRVTKNGSKLVKLAGASPRQDRAFHVQTYSCEDDNSPPNATPKVATIAGVRFYRSKNGNLYRHGIVKAQRYVGLPDGTEHLTQKPLSRSGAIKKIDQPCQIFSTTGSCPKGPQCRYNHNPSTVAVCKDFLQRGECASGDSCDLSHILTPERTPTCVHFLKGNCSNPNCRFTHVKTAPGAPVCRSFGFYGYCENGADCTDRHVFECPDFSNTGICKNKRCKLPHRERASVLRKAAAAREHNPEKKEEEEDISSDDDDGDAVDSDDVDSDEVEEFIGEEDSLAVEFTDQKDFIQL